MDTSVLSTIMLAVGMLMLMFPFVVYIALGPLLGAVDGDLRLIGTLIVGGAILMYGISVGVFALVQRYNCGSVQSMKRVAENAGISTSIYSILMILASIIPWLRSVVTNVLPPEIGSNISQSLGYGYYSFWGSLFGIAVGGSLSGICN
jgi:hypothetical protein